MTNLQKIVELVSKIKATSKCCTCGVVINPHDYRQKYGRKYCSISCEDIGEEINQGAETLISELC